jgi:hypothetical protein
VDNLGAENLMIYGGLQVFRNAAQMPRCTFIVHMPILQAKSFFVYWWVRLKAIGKAGNRTGKERHRLSYTRA